MKNLEGRRREGRAAKYTTPVPSRGAQFARRPCAGREGVAGEGLVWCPSTRWAPQRDCNQAARRGIEAPIRNRAIIVHSVSVDNGFTSKHFDQVPPSVATKAAPRREFDVQNPCKTCNSAVVALLSSCHAGGSAAATWGYSFNTGD